MPQAVDGTLRKFALRVPEVIYQCSGIMVFGKRIKSLVFSTDLSIIKNVNADAIIAVYPFTPQPIINEALLMASDIPVFTGVGGGLLRDVMAGDMPYIFVKHIYACASLVGAVICGVLRQPAGEMTAMLVGAAAVFAIRCLSAHYRWNLPHPNA